MRTIATQPAKYGGKAIKGLTVPSHIVPFFDNVTFTRVYKSGNALIFESGTTTHVTIEEIKKYNFDDVILKGGLNHGN